MKTFFKYVNRKATWIFLLPLISACSQVNFETTEEFLIANDIELTSILINNGDEFTNDRTVLLTLDGRGAKEMKISNDSDCEDGRWEPYSSSKYWQLKNGNSEVSVFALFKSKSGSISGCRSDAIVNDEIAPQIAFQKNQGMWSNTNHQTVPFTVTDNFTGVSEVKCSLDKINWSNCVNEYAMTVPGEGQQFAYVKAKDRVGNQSNIESFNWSVDRTPPVVTIHSYPAQLTNSREGEVIFSAVDDLSLVKGFLCKVDGGIQQSCSSPLKLMGLSEGSHSVLVQALDYAGNVSMPQSVVWKVDASAPTVEITKAPDPITNKKVARFEFVGNDKGIPLSDFQCSLDNGPYGSCTSPYQSVDLGDGTHIFKVTVKDDAGNVSSPATYSWVIDTIKPTIAFEKTPKLFSNSAESRFLMKAFDTGYTNPQVTYYCSLKGETLKVCSSDYTFTLPVDGSYTFQAKAVDKAGNSSDIIEYSWMLDRVPPVLSLGSIPNDVIGDVVVSISFSATDDRSGVSHTNCNYNSGGASLCTSPFVKEEMEEGAHVVKIVAYDKAGNVSQEQVVIWNVDKTSPEIEFITVPMNPEEGTTADLLFSATDKGESLPSSHLQCFFNGELQATCESLVPQQLLMSHSGVATFKVIAMDLAGNTSQATAEWNVLAVQPPADKMTTVTVGDPKVDILFVVDNSKSMETIQANMASRIQGFLTNIDGMDWQIAFTLTDVDYRIGAVKQDGVLLKLEGTSADLNSISHDTILSSAMDPQAVGRVIGATLQREETGSGDEQGIYATYRAIERSQMSGSLNAPNRSFFRNDAALSIILISDEDETFIQGHQNSPQSLIDKVQSTFPNKNFTYNSIIVKPGDLACLDDRGWFVWWGTQVRIGKYGQTYADLSSLLGAGTAGGSMIGSVCESNYSSQLQDIGQSVRDIVKGATLECEPYNGEVQLFSYDSVNGETPLNMSYVVSGVKILFNKELPIGTYHLRYSCQP
ncbi:MAG: Ig-like domain repeat protein [Bdellovibrionales bacterium]|nr:Ig-like domain repeat protein [Bdellovibrionales bacterium]